MKGTFRYIAGQKQPMLSNDGRTLYHGICSTLPTGEGQTARAALRRARTATLDRSELWPTIAVWDREEGRYIEASTIDEEEERANGLKAHDRWAKLGAKAAREDRYGTRR